MKAITFVQQRLKTNGQVKDSGWRMADKSEIDKGRAMFSAGISKATKLDDGDSDLLQIPNMVKPSFEPRETMTYSGDINSGEVTSLFQADSHDTFMYHSVKPDSLDSLTAWESDGKAKVTHLKMRNDLAVQQDVYLVADEHGWQMVDKIERTGKSATDFRPV